MTRTPLFFVLFISLLLLPVVVSAAPAEYTRQFMNSETVVVNQSYVIDQTGTTPFAVWAGCIILGFALLIISFLQFPMGEEVLVSVLAWIPFGYATFTSFAVDMMGGFGVAAVNLSTTKSPFSEFALMENHIIYHFDVAAVILLILTVFAVGNTFRIAANQKRLKEMAEIQPTFDERTRGGQPPPE
jgi:hypothetical protein